MRLVKKECGIQSLSKYEKNDEVLFSFLNELADRGHISQIDKIFKSGSGIYPLVNNISCNYKKKFNELFQKLPEWYQNKLLGETISYEEGDKTYTCSLIGGTALMGFQLRYKFCIVLTLTEFCHKLNKFPNKYYLIEENESIQIKIFFKEKIN